MGITDSTTILSYLLALSKKFSSFEETIYNNGENPRTGCVGGGPRDSPAPTIPTTGCLPWAISSCRFASPNAEKRSSLIRVSALRLFSKCCVLSCMADSADINTSVSFSFSLYFRSSCRSNEDKCYSCRCHR